MWLSLFCLGGIMFNNPYMLQPSVDRINNQIAELEKMKQQLQQPVTAPTNLTQNFQLAPTNNNMRYANSFEEVKKDIVIADTPYFSKDMSVLWLKNTQGQIKTYELTEIMPKDEKDLKIEFLVAKIDTLEKEMKKYEHNGDVNEPVEDEKPTSVSTISKPKAKSK